MKANATQRLLQDEGVKFWGHLICPGKSPDMNPPENIGAIIKDKVEELIVSEDCQNRYSYNVVETNIENALRNVEDDTEFFFIDLLCSIRKDLMLSKPLEGSYNVLRLSHIHLFMKNLHF